jgi:RNA polymerase sigma-70 factor (ECF subfamily)
MPLGVLGEKGRGMRLWASGLDESALRAAYGAHGPMLRNVAERILFDRSLAEEAVQETFLRAWKARTRFDPRLGSLEAWLVVICRRVAIDMARARRARPSDATDPADLESGLDARSAAGGEDALESALRAWQIEEGLRRLRPEHRRALVEVYWRGRPAAEFAAEIGVPEGTVRSRCFYGLRALRLALEELGVDAR